MAWVLAGAAGLALALVQYGRARGHAWAPALCRWGAATTLTALALDAPAGRASSLRPFAALDVSASWHRARGIGPDADGYRRALAAIAAARPESLFLVGDSLRVTPPPASPTDNRSRIRPAIDRAAAAGRALVLVTDGEIDDPEALDALPAGSEIKVIATPEGSDAALVGVDAPRTAIAGDTITVHAAVAAGSAGAGAGHLTLRLDDALQASIPLPAMAPYGEQRVEARVSVSGTNGARVLRAIVTAAGDVEPRNDTVGIALDVAPAVGAVFVSTSPDEDARYALSVLRGTLALPTRAFFRVSPGNWRQEGTLAAASEEEVRRAVGLAPLVVLHGDTAVFGAPRTVTRGGLALVVPPAPGGTRGESDEWYATSAPPSPISAALHAVPWDSLAPIDVGEIAPINAAANGGGGAWAALEARRARRFEPRVAVAGSERNGRRAVIVAASGLWRWRVRGGGGGADAGGSAGAGTAAFTALWGGIFDWLAAAAADDRAAIPAEGVRREGDSLQWRRGSRADSVVPVILIPRGGGQHGRADTTIARFIGGAATAATPPMPAGVYDVRVRGGTAIVVVNASREWLPRRPAAHSGRQGTVAVAGLVPRLRGLGWAYALVIIALGAEWLLRRRMGLR
jgi:hypothetical protein